LSKSTWNVITVLGLLFVSTCFGFAYGVKTFDEKLRADKLKGMRLMEAASRYVLRPEAEPSDGNPTFPHVFQYQIFIPDSTYQPLEAEAQRRQMSVDALASQWIKDKFSELQKERAWR
jgi:hypothetical protein